MFLHKPIPAKPAQQAENKGDPCEAYVLRLHMGTLRAFPYQPYGIVSLTLFVVQVMVYTDLTYVYKEGKPLAEDAQNGLPLLAAGAV